MPGWKPIKRRDFIRRLRGLGFEGPYRGTRHEFLVFGQHRQTIPANPEYSVPQLRLLLHQVETILRRSITPDEWQRL
jgi:hypothetical protein